MKKYFIMLILGLSLFSFSAQAVEKEDYHFGTAVQSRDIVKKQSQEDSPQKMLDIYTEETLEPIRNVDTNDSILPRENTPANDIDTNMDTNEEIYIYESVE